MCGHLSMGKLLFKGKAFVSVYWALMAMSITAEQEYFPRSRNVTWDEAREHCQACYEDLVTLTPGNIQTITQKLTSDYWVGLRKNFYSTGDPSMSWTYWANGDPLTFQNWYPGWPMLNPSLPNRDYSCRCSCTSTSPTARSSNTFTEFTTPNVSENAFQNWTHMSSFSNVTDQAMTGATGIGESSTPSTTAALFTDRLCEASCVPDVPDTIENYIEDSCVVMLSFGAWIEKNCLELLPFICYEERFFGQVNVTNVTSSSANVTWLEGPGNISHYRLEVKSYQEPIINLTDLTYSLVNLTAGTHYSIQVFPVKCERDLNPQEVAFYTIPNKVENLTVTECTDVSISLAWNRSAGNVDFYLIKVQGEEKIRNTEDIKVGNLTSGSRYKFTVLSGVGNNSIYSEESSIEGHTKPGKASNLTVSNNTNDSLLLTWQPPPGLTTGYVVTAVNDSDQTLFTETLNHTEVKVTGLPMGTRITLSVAALANDTLKGDKVTVVSFTAPGPVSNLTLVTTHDSLNATWTSPVHNYSRFNVTLELDGTNVTTDSIQEPRKHFDHLKAGANYTVIVYSVNGRFEGPPVKSSKFTRPLPPTDLSIPFFDKQQITLQWKAPANTAAVTYSVKISSSFWGHSWSLTVNDKTNHTFSDLKSGTKYDFEIQTVAGGNSSIAVLTSHFTVAEEREVSLSMLCSSAEFLLCDKNTTRESVFNQLQAHFNSLLGDNIFWKLEAQEAENQGTQ
uniref:fibronectin n=1 Tax=Scatophagus argus TaxID=75038 RepID=UPI001ED81CBB|nr:fibronectin [Scatophagus argus]